MSQVLSNKIKITLKGKDITGQTTSLMINDFDTENADTATLTCVYDFKADFGDIIEVFANSQLLGRFFVSDITLHYKESTEIHAQSIDYEKDLTCSHRLCYA